LTENDLATAVQTVVTTWLIEEGVESAELALRDVEALGHRLSAAVHEEFVAKEIEVNVDEFLHSRPAIHLQGVFDTSQLPATPEDILPGAELEIDSSCTGLCDCCAELPRVGDHCVRQ